MLNFDQDRFVATSGRTPHPTRPDEVAFNEFAAAQSGYRIGDVIHLALYRPTEFAGPTGPPPEQLEAAGHGEIANTLA